MRRIRLTFVVEGVSADAELLEDLAPQTCQALWESLPAAGMAHHAVYSGSEGVLILPSVLRVAPENATSDVTTGDVGFTWFAAGQAHGVDADFAEICWFYGPDARPSMHEGPVPVSIFARIVGDPDAFYAACRRMRREGIKALSVERLEPTDDLRAEHAVAYRVPHFRAHSPNVTVTAEGDVAIAFVRGQDYGHDVAADPVAVAAVVRSRDGGRTWSSPADVVGEYMLPGARAVALTALGGGRLAADVEVAAFASIHRSGTVGFERYDAAGAPYPEAGWLTGPSAWQRTVSGDNGMTWSEPEPASPPPVVGASGDRAPTIGLADGRMLAAWRSSASPGGILGGVSVDGGATFEEFSIREFGLWDMRRPDVAQLPDGAIACVYDALDAPPDSDPPRAVRGIHVTRFRLPSR